MGCRVWGTVHERIYAYRCICSQPLPPSCACVPLCADRVSLRFTRICCHYCLDIQHCLHSLAAAGGGRRNGSQTAVAPSITPASVTVAAGSGACARHTCHIPHAGQTHTTYLTQARQAMQAAHAIHATVHTFVHRRACMTRAHREHACLHLCRVENGTNSVCHASDHPNHHLGLPSPHA